MSEENHSAQNTAVAAQPESKPQKISFSIAIAIGLYWIVLLVTGGKLSTHLLLIGAVGIVLLWRVGYLAGGLNKAISSVTTMAVIGALAAIPNTPPTIATPLTMFCLAALGFWTLVDIDRARESRMPSPLMMHVVSFLFGAASSAILSLPHGASQWAPLGFFAVQMQVYFMLFGLSLSVQGRERSSATLTTLIMLATFAMCRPLVRFDAGWPPATLLEFFVVIDPRGLIVLICGLTGGSTAAFMSERDPIVLERKFVFGWAGASTAMLLLWWVWAA